MVQKVVDKASANDVANQIAGKWVDAKQLGDLKTDVEDNYLPLSGGTMTGDLLLNRDPVSSLQAVTKQYVDKNELILEVKTYVGSGNTTVNKPVTLNFDVAPYVFIMPNTTQYNRLYSNSLYLVDNIQNDYQIYVYASGIYFNMRKQNNGKTIQFYDGNGDFGSNGVTYKYAVIYKNSQL